MVWDGMPAGRRVRATRGARGVTGVTRSATFGPMPRPRRDEQVVWSSTDGDLRRARPAPDPARAPAGGRVKVRREVAGRRGKTVTTVSGVPLGEAGLRELAGRLKKRCGVGGSAKDGVIELQGDHRDVVVEVLRADGYDVVLAGG
jgi:translation initiation factor 1